MSGEPVAQVPEPAPELRSRLATRVPRCRAIDLPPGRWNREGHLDAPVTTWMEPVLAAQASGFRAGFVHWGFPVVEIRQLLVEVQDVWGAAEAELDVQGAGRDELTRQRVVAFLAEWRQEVARNPRRHALDLRAHP